MLGGKIHGQPGRGNYMVYRSPVEGENRTSVENIGNIKYNNININIINNLTIIIGRLAQFRKYESNFFAKFRIDPIVFNTQYLGGEVHHNHHQSLWGSERVGFRIQGLRGWHKGLKGKRFFHFCEKRK
jgi:hypothetical protein